MKYSGQSLVLIGIFLGANVVAAGVMQVLGQIMQQVAPDLHSQWIWFVIGGIGAFAAYLFVRGAIVHFSGSSLIQWRRGQRGG